MSVSARTSSLVPIVACNSWRSYWVGQVKWIKLGGRINMSHTTYISTSPPLTWSLQTCLTLRAPDELGALALTGGGVKHWLGDAGLRRAWLAAAAAGLVLLQLHLLPRLSLVPALALGLDHHIHNLLSNLENVMSPEHITRFVWSNCFRTNRNCTA